jgi:hypothetical protein
LSPANPKELVCESLNPLELVIPFSKDIVNFVNKNGLLFIAARRAFKRVMAVTQTIACTYQYQRKRNAAGKLVAEIADYYMALQIVREAFRESVGQQSRESEKRIAFIGENGTVSYRNLSDEWGISKSANFPVGSLSRSRRNPQLV